MRMNKKIILILLTTGVLLLFRSCTESYLPEISNADMEAILVVEGQITDVDGPFTVKLSRSFALNSPLLYGDTVTGANVQIIDDKGNLFQLFHTSGGVYETQDKHLRGVPGNTYILQITTDDGDQYESTPVEMLTPPGIDSVYFAEEYFTDPQNPHSGSQKRMNIMADSKASGGPPEYLKWSFDETWEISLIKDGVRVRQGDTQNSITQENVELAPGVVQTCWITRPSVSTLVASSKNTADNRISEYLLTSIKEGTDRLYIKYSILVKQYALTEKMYKFWKVLEETNENPGGIYEHVPSQIYGNIECCNREGKALGYFTASSVKTRRIFIAAADHSVKTSSPYAGCIYLKHPNPRVVAFVYGRSLATGEKVYTQDVYCSDCRLYGSAVKPDFWDDDK